MVTGLVQQVALGNILGPAGYGALNTAMGIASISYNPLIQTGIQGVSRPVAPVDPVQRPGVIRAVLRVHFALGVSMAVLFFFAAPLIGYLTNAPYLVPAFRLFSGVLLAYALYGPLIGVLNGQQRFLHQAGLDVMAATLRTIAMVGAAWWFMRTYQEGVAGAAIGFGVSASLMFLIAVSLTGLGRRGMGPSAAEHLRFIGPLLLGQFILNLLFQADLQLLGRFAREAALVAGTSVERADELVGAYRAAQLFGFLPYQLLIAISFVLFPLLAKAARERDVVAVAEYVRTGVRLALILAGLAVSVSAALPRQLLKLVFPSQPFAEIGGDAMRILVLALAAFAIFGVLVTVLNSLGEERPAMALTALAFAAIAGLCWIFVRGEPFNQALLTRTALAAAGGHSLAVVTAAVLVKRRARAVVRWRTLLRVFCAMAVAIAVGLQLPERGKVMTLLFSALIVTIYLVVLAVLQELGRADLKLVARVVGRR
jgi:stage V sporulation protein B